ncbi:MAG: hypothetical protein V1740_02715 [Candidatus Woesearchaeota archaeon]
MIDIFRVKEFVEHCYKGSEQILIYHSLYHTDQMYREGVRIACSECIDGLGMLRLQAGLLLHDIGNLVNRKGHEEIGAKISELMLPIYGADQEDIKVVRGIIIATQLPQQPKNLLEQIACDADLSLIGYVENQWTCGVDRLQVEIYGCDELFKYEGYEERQKEFWIGQVNFLTSHKFFTKTAKELFDGQKKKNIQYAQKKANEYSKYSK